MQQILHGLVGFTLVLMLGACQSPPVDNTVGASQPPVAKKIPSMREYHGQVLHDDYLWLKDARPFRCGRSPSPAARLSALLSL